jgi:hypothetical protein
VWPEFPNDEIEVTGEGWLYGQPWAENVPPNVYELVMWIDKEYCGEVGVEGITATFFISKETVLKVLDEIDLKWEDFIKDDYHGFSVEKVVAKGVFKGVQEGANGDLILMFMEKGIDFETWYDFGS